MLAPEPGFQAKALIPRGSAVESLMIRKIQNRRFTPHPKALTSRGRVPTNTGLLCWLEMESPTESPVPLPIYLGHLPDTAHLASVI